MEEQLVVAMSQIRFRFIATLSIRIRLQLQVQLFTSPFYISDLNSLPELRCELLCSTWVPHLAVCLGQRRPAATKIPCQSWEGKGSELYTPSVVT